MNHIGEYLFGFLVGVVTLYLAYKPQFKQLDEILDNINSKLGNIEKSITTSANVCDAHKK